METWVLIAVILVLLCLIYYNRGRTFRGFAAATKRAEQLMKAAPNLKNYDSFKRAGGKDVVEYDIMRSLSKTNQLNMTSLTTALIPYESYYRGS